MYLNHLNAPLIIRISDEMVPYFNVLGFRMKHWILHNTNGAFIINVNLGVHEIDPINQASICIPSTHATSKQQQTNYCLSSGVATIVFAFYIAKKSTFCQEIDNLLLWNSINATSSKITTKKASKSNGESLETKGLIWIDLQVSTESSSHHEELGIRLKKT
ncbi:hypothetical protein Tco_0281662 [Tanacetum coccineum]